MKVGVVVNPAAGGGRLRASAGAIEALVRASFDEVVLRETEEPGDGCVLARDFALEGCGLVIAAGGDGTASEVADGLLQAAGQEGTAAELAVMPVGTGTDFSRGLQLGGSAEDIVARLAQGRKRRIDAGRISYIDEQGRLAQRHFINIASLGLSGATDSAVNGDARKQRVPARALFLWHTVLQFLRYRFEHVRISIDGNEAFEARIALVAVANGRYFGGGMMIAPDAEPDDGFFDIVVLRAASKLRLLADLRLVYGGRHRNHPAITIIRGREVTVEPIGPAALVDADGESPGRIPATFEMLPGALTLRF